MSDARFIIQADIHQTDTPTPAEAHNTSDRSPDTLIPHDFGSKSPVASPIKTAESPTQTINPKKRKLDSSNTTPTSSTFPASIVAFALYFCAAGPINTLTKVLTANKVGIWFKKQKIHFDKIKEAHKGFQIIFPDQDSLNAAKKITQIFQYTVTHQTPNWQLYTRGVIRVNPRETEEDLQMYVKEANDNTDAFPQPKITSTRRITSKRNGKTSNTPIVIINFQKSAKYPEAPKFISFGAATKLEVKPYIKQVKQCSNCLRYNHTANGCKFQKTKCRKCAQTDCPGTCAPWCIHCKNTEHSSLSNKCPHRHTLTQQANRHINIDTAKHQTRKQTQHPKQPLLPTPQPNNTPHLVSAWDGILQGVHSATITPIHHTHNPQTTTTPITITTSTPARKKNHVSLATTHPKTIHPSATRATTTRPKQAQPKNPNSNQTTDIPSTQTQTQTQPDTQTTPMESEEINQDNTDNYDFTTDEDTNEITRSAPKKTKNHKRKPQTIPNSKLNNITILLAYMLREINPNASTKALHKVAYKLRLTNQTYESFNLGLKKATSN